MTSTVYYVYLVAMLVERDRWGTLQIPETSWGGGSAVYALNTLLGLRDDAQYLDWFQETWGTAGSRRRARGWLRVGSVDVLRDAARAFPQLPYAALAPFLASVKQKDGPAVDIPDLPALAAWCLLNLTVASSKVRAVECPSCNRPWLTGRASRGGRYCNRPAPGKRTTCSQTNKHAVFAERRADWNREYRKIYARKLRGSISEQDWNEWRALHADAAIIERGGWLPFDSWIASRADLEPLFAAREANKQATKARMEANLAAIRRVLADHIRTEGGKPDA